MLLNAKLVVRNTQIRIVRMNKVLTCYNVILRVLFLYQQIYKNQWNNKYRIVILLRHAERPEYQTHYCLRQSNESFGICFVKIYIEEIFIKRNIVAGYIFNWENVSLNSCYWIVYYFNWMNMAESVRQTEIIMYRYGYNLIW